MMRKLNDKQSSDDGLVLNLRLSVHETVSRVSDLLRLPEVDTLLPQKGRR
jgi:hypothetical protein